ncbi:MAG: phosphoglycerate kinase [Alphaproteobacteria bacterium]|nr:phosphoglycerate kinase [Alphaproteobacteria bacterium]
MKTLDAFTVKGKVVLLRLDINVPMQQGVITDTTRLERSMPTVRELSQKGAVVVILSHLGRPGGKVDAALSLAPIAAALQPLLAPINLRFVAATRGDAVRSAVAAAKPGDVLLLENIRFEMGEEKNDAALVQELAGIADIYINDAFSAAHRAHASTAGLAGALPSGAGRLMQAELEALAAALTTPARPVAAIVGGSKVSTKIDLLHNLTGKVNLLAIGGGMANTFLYAMGHEVGASLCEKDAKATVMAILKQADSLGCKILLPTDAVVAPRFAADAPASVVPVTAVPDGQMILDIGAATLSAWTAAFASCRTIVWNGPVGAFEMKPFAAGSMGIARYLSAATQRGVKTIAGGGDTVAALVAADALDSLTYVSTAGGAFLEWMEGKDLPGVTALQRAA